MSSTPHDLLSAYVTPALLGGSAAGPVPILAFDAPKLPPIQPQHALVPAGFFVAKGLAVGQSTGESWAKSISEASGVELENLTTPALLKWWVGYNGELHKAIYSGGTALMTGAAVPDEAMDPLKTKAYLIALLVQIGERNGWPGEARRLATMMEAVVPSTLVGETIDRLQAFGPSEGLRGAQDWYDIGNQVRLAAGNVSAGEIAGLWVHYAQKGAGAISQGFNYMSQLVTELRRYGDIAAIGVGITVAGVIVSVLAWFFSPELLGAYVWAKQRKQRKGGK